MQDPAAAFLTAKERDDIAAAVRAAEKQTSGEIVPVVVSSSYHYPMAAVLGAAAISLPSAILMTYLVGGYLWLGPQNMWLFMGVFAALFALLHWVINRTPAVKRLFVSSREIEDEVSEAAVTTFFREGLYRTRDETGILIFVSVFEHKVWVLADRGINAKVAPERWQAVVDHITAGIRSKRQGRAICEAVADVGGILAAHFPRRADDTDELENLIVRDHDAD